MENIVLIDGHNLLFRMFYGIPSPIKNTKGIDIRGLIGFIGSLKKLVHEFNPYSVVVIFDSETSKNDNLKIDSTYKANRVDYSNVDSEENPFTVLPLIKKALDYLDIEHIEVDSYEADDYIASIVTKLNDLSFQFVIVSTDSDFIQLVNKNVFLYVPRGKMSVLYDEENVIKKYNVTSKKYVLYKSLVGDKSDNIEGIKGIGKITAANILSYNSIEDYILNNGESRYSRILRESEAVIKKNINLITMKSNLTVDTINFNKLSNKIYNNKTYEIIENIGER